ncbi:hypothetical protein LTR99_010512 [Exophiala xenobiotica]|uniref:CMP/dCMP-type deaminase domain-containing protein n=1 Tax=Vermiconidia calcicola TaxID=1690605 RepID=A0AAV9PSJ7_9PEZI|nr:hypothetical protein LTR92_007535 [Exophiala xenobiotica]KAK5528669.1 hypothetical protein LTR25_010282 [Vermiconidia calcicola]KAK5546093.1 hypothetical protein LTR23_003900 [Chaetothyriales sp. CCFEE 6169]KAK5267656.1 hypothetical protein LTR96_006984 [Exophiala xenobiotica]KAK5292368.1 hypothetical protein LTR99_010512 [Exophiala xenobiotica]
MANIATCHSVRDSPVHPSISSDVDLDLGQDPIPLATREYWMRRAIGALDDVVGSPCPFAAFGAVIVNHTTSTGAVVSEDDADAGMGMGEEVCIGANSVQGLGNPTLHGEIAAINNCTNILTDSAGKYKLSGAEALRALSDLSLYTTAEPCPMCSSAILYGAFREYIYSTPIHGEHSLIAHGWPQIDLPSKEIFARSVGRSVRTRIVPEVLVNETEGLFAWQFDGGDCPAGCAKKEGGKGWCVKQVEDEEEAGVKVGGKKEGVRNEL